MNKPDSRIASSSDPPPFRRKSKNNPVHLFLRQLPDQSRHVTVVLFGSASPLRPSSSNVE